MSAFTLMEKIRSNSSDVLSSMSFANTTPALPTAAVKMAIDRFGGLDAVDGHLHRGVVRRAVRYVANERRDGLAPVRRRRPQLRSVTIHGDERPARAGEGFGDPSADALRGARDDDRAHDRPQLRSKTSSIMAHHSPGLASGARS